MESSNFRVDVEADERVLVLRLRGELDLATVPEVEELVDRNLDRRALVVDLRELSFMDSSGVRLVVELHDRHSETPVAFIPPGDRIGRLLDMTGVRSKLTWVSEPHEALRTVE